MRPRLSPRQQSPWAQLRSRLRCCRRQPLVCCDQHRQRGVQHRDLLGAQPVGRTSKQLLWIAQRLPRLRTAQPSRSQVSVPTLPLVMMPILTLAVTVPICLVCLLFTAYTVRRASIKTMTIINGVIGAGLMTAPPQRQPEPAAVPSAAHASSQVRLDVSWCPLHFHPSTVAFSARSCWMLRIAVRGREHSQGWRSTDALHAQGTAEAGDTVMEDEDANDLSDGDAVYRPPPERPRPAGKGRRVAAAAAGLLNPSRRRAAKASDGAAAQADAAHAASAALPGTRRPSWLTQPQAPPPQAASQASAPRRAGGARRGRAARSGPAAQGLLAGAARNPPAARPSKRRRRVRRIDLDAGTEDSEATVSDEGALQSDGEDSDATQSDDGQLALPPKKRRTGGERALAASNSAVPPPAAPAVAPTAAEYDEDNGAIDYDPDSPPPSESQPHRAATNMPTLRPAALPGQFAYGTLHDPAYEGSAQQDPSTAAPAAGSPDGESSREVLGEVPTSVPVIRPAPLQGAVAGEPPAAAGSNAETAANEEQTSAPEGHQQAAEAAMQDHREPGCRSGWGAADQQCETTHGAARQQEVRQQAVVQAQPPEPRDDRGALDAARQNDGPASSEQGRGHQRAPPSPPRTSAAPLQSRRRSSAASPVFERVELPGSPPSSVGRLDRARRESRSQRPMPTVTPPPAFERAELPPSPGAVSEERRARSVSRSHHSQQSPGHRPVPSPQQPVFERAELPGTPPSVPRADAGLQRNGAPPAAELSRAVAAPAEVAFHRVELSPSPSPSDRVPRTEGPSEKEGLPASGVTCPGGPSTRDVVVFQREELPPSPLPSASARATPAASEHRRNVLPPTASPVSSAVAPSGHVFHREELPPSPSPGAGTSMLPDVAFEREELPLSPPGDSAMHVQALHAVFQREELPVTPPRAGGAQASAAATTFHREELPPSPPGTNLHAAAVDRGTVFQREVLPPSPADVEVTRTELHRDTARATDVQSPSASAATLTHSLQNPAATRAPQAQPSEPVPYVVPAQSSAPASPNGRSARAMAWLQRRGKLPPMQARARVSQH